MGTDRRLDDLLDAVPWARLAHAYAAALDAPARLRALAASVRTGADDELDEFEYWLQSSIVHQGTPYSATAPVLWIARRILGDSPTHPALAWCLDAVVEVAGALRWPAEHAPGDDEKAPAPEPEPQRSGPDQPLWATYLPPGRKLAAPSEDDDGEIDADYFLAARPDPRTLTAAVADWEPVVVRCLADRRFLDSAIAAASALIRLAPSVPLTEALRPLVDELDDDEQRAAVAYALCAPGQGPEDIDALIAHDDRAIRVAAALARPDHAQALDILVPAATDREWVRSTFPDGFAGPGPWLRSALLVAVLDRVSVRDADAALIDGLELQLATATYGPFGASYEWGPVLAWLFPDRHRSRRYLDVPDPGDLSPTQRRLLAALARNDDPWVAGAGNAAAALGQVGLPHDRGVVAALGQDRPG